jgi:hypothetical protein
VDQRGSIRTKRRPEGHGPARDDGLASSGVESQAAASELLRDRAIAPMQAVVTRLSKLREDIERRRRSKT